MQYEGIVCDVTLLAGAWDDVEAQVFAIGDDVITESTGQVITPGGWD